MRKILALCLSLLAFSCFAQEGELPEEQIVIQKDRKIVLPEVSKPAVKVVNTLKPLPKIAQKYNYREYGIALPNIDPKIQPPVFRPLPEDPVREGYARIAAGNYGSTEMDLWYNSGRRKDFAYGLAFHHMASAKGPVANSGFSNNALQVNGIYFTPSFTLDGNLNYRRDRYNFYGYDQEKFNLRNADTTRQLFQSIWFRMNLTSRNKEKDKFFWKAGLGLGNLSDRFRASESEVLLDADGRYRLSDSASLVLFSDFSLLKKSDSSAQNRVLWRLQPAYHFGFKGFSIDAGFQFSFVSEPVLLNTGSFRESSAVHLHPRLNVELALSGNELKAFAAVSGGMNRRSLRNQVEQNPFLMPDVYLRHENQLLNISFGLKGASKGVLQYHSNLTFGKINQLAFFRNADSLNREKFAIVYDSASTRRFSWETEAVYDPGKGRRAGIRFTYFAYNLSSLPQAWHLPRTQASAFGSISLSDHFSISAEFFFLGGMKSWNPRTLTTEKLSSIADLNVKGEYRFKKNFSGFIAFHNILNNKNPRFLHYPGQGFRLMLGASAFF